MEEAAVHAVDNLAASPGFIFALGCLVILAGVAIKVVPIWRTLREKQLDNEAKFRSAQIDIERDRELRKMDELKMRAERDRESAVIMQRSVDAQERSTAAMNAMTQQMAVMSGQLELSQERSADMGHKIENIHVMTCAIHDEVVRK